MNVKPSSKPAASKTSTARKALPSQESDLFVAKGVAAGLSAPFPAVRAVTGKSKAVAKQQEIVIPEEPIICSRFPGITRVPGISPKIEALLERMGIRTMEDLLFHLPARYEDRRTCARLQDAVAGTSFTYMGRILKADAKRWRGGRMVFELLLSPSGPDEMPSKDEILTCRWYNMFGLNKVLTPGKEIFVYGKIIKGKTGWSMTHPDFEIAEPELPAAEGEATAQGTVSPGGNPRRLHTGRIVPIYPLTEGLTQRNLRQIMHRAVTLYGPEMEEDYEAPPVLPKLAKAVPAVHFPESWNERDSARQRLAYDEFFAQQLVLARRRNKRMRVEKTRPLPLQPDHPAYGLARRWLETLPFSPTGAQQRVMAEMERDMAAGVAMNRLLQGDVGSGKTLVATYAMLLAAGHGFQAVLMAPTEILAEQHYLNLSKWLAPLGIAVGLHTGNRKFLHSHNIGEGELALGALPSMETPAGPSVASVAGSIVVGTHALVYESFIADNLGLVVIDEQHKFGVLQRAALTRKGDNPDVLVMTATPIPRTLRLTLYGDLDVSILDELPPGRTPITTAVRRPNDLDRMWEFARAQIKAGRQMYVVCPLVEESEKVEARAAQAELESVRKHMPGVNVGLLHGRMPGEEKDAVMKKFRALEVQVLVSTSVIEVGVDVPNATMMVVVNAERFGLAQLHQLRGRIGRGAQKSYCVLVSEPGSEDGWRRLKVMEDTCDGFKIAEEDLRLRGPGNIFGTEQSGLPKPRFGNPVTDLPLLQQARQHAAEVIAADSDLEKHPKLKQLVDRLILGGGNVDGG